MSLTDRYSLKPEGLEHRVDEAYEAIFNWQYSDSRTDLLQLYDKGKRMQWDAQTRIDWSGDIDEGNPMGMPEELFALKGMPLYEKMSDKEKGVVRRHHQCWTLSQFLHGEQGALFCAAKIVQSVPDLEAKLYAASQTIDEARHVEAYKKLLEKFELAYPMTGPLQELLDQVLRDSRWDMTYLGMQVVIEGLALAAFAGIRDHATNQMAASVNAYVMQDEARHVAFGRLSLRDYYPQLTQKERDEREEFLVEACYLMRDRFESREVWAHLDLPVDECVEHMKHSEGQKMFRTFLFNRIVPVVKDIGLWGPRVVKGYEQMGVLAFADVNVDALQAQDEEIAAQFDARRKHIEEVAAVAAE
ncbi:ferritin-like domain-containing protein [Parapedomonas caeni]